MGIRVITANVSVDFLNPPGVPTWEERKALFGKLYATPNQI